MMAAEKNDSNEQLEDRNGSEEKQTGITPAAEVEGKEGLRTVDAGYSADQVVTEFSELEQRRIMRKVDFRLVPLLSVLYLYVSLESRPTPNRCLYFLVLHTLIEAISEMLKSPAWRKTSTLSVSAII
jgi:hypothetical protein